VWVRVLGPVGVGDAAGADPDNAFHLNKNIRPEADISSR
jgi:hypothetical protein